MSSKKHSHQSASAEGDGVDFALESDSSDHIDVKGTLQHVSVEHQFRVWARFLALWTVSGANYFAYGTMGLALALFATHLTRLPLLVSGVGFAQLLPAFVLGLPAGVLVDRYDRRLILISTTAVRVVAFALAILAVLMGFVTLPLLYALALLLGITETVEEPAIAAAVPMVMPQAKLERANTLLVGAQNILGLLVDPLGALFVSISIVLSMSISGLCAGVALVALFCLRGTLRPPFRSNWGYSDKDVAVKAMPTKAETEPRHSTRGMAQRHSGVDALEGLRYLWNERLLLMIALMAGIINACWSGYLVVMVLYAVAPGPLGLTTPAYGVMLMLISIGSITGAFLTLPIQRWLGRRWAIGLNIFGNGLMFATPALTHNLWLIGGAMFLGGMGGPMWTIAAAALQGRIVSSELQGRVNASYRVLSIGMSALGPMLGGLLAQIFGLPAALALFGILTWLQFIPFFWVVTEQAMMRKL